MINRNVLIFNADSNYFYLSFLLLFIRSSATVLDELLPKEKVDKEEMISAWIEIQRQYAFAPETDEERA